MKVTKACNTRSAVRFPRQQCFAVHPTKRLPMRARWCVCFGNTALPRCGRCRCCFSASHRETRSGLFHNDNDANKNRLRLSEPTIERVCLSSAALLLLLLLTAAAAACVCLCFPRVSSPAREFSARLGEIVFWRVLICLFIYQSWWRWWR